MDNKELLNKLSMKFSKFSKSVSQSSPLYTVLSENVAKNEAILKMIVSSNQNKQPEPNILFGAIHYLLQNGTNHPLKNYFPSVTDHALSNLDNLKNDFNDFCKKYKSQIMQIISKRYVQTNEIGRCCTFIPAFALIMQNQDIKSLSLIEIGTSAGLNLFWDKYSYKFNDIEIKNYPNSLVLECDVRNEKTIPLLTKLPNITDRIGIDINPLDMKNKEDQRWLKALIWPEQLDRIQRLNSAIKIAEKSQLTILKGDVRDKLLEAIKIADKKSQLVIFHSFMFYMLDRKVIDEIEHIMLNASKKRDIYFISLFWDNPPQGKTYLKLTKYSNGYENSEILAQCHFHGEWIKWLK